MNYVSFRAHPFLLGRAGPVRSAVGPRGLRPAARTPGRTAVCVQSTHPAQRHGGPTATATYVANQHANNALFPHDFD